MAEQIHAIEVEAPPELLWEMLTTPAGIHRWFVTESHVEPGVGGSIRYVWEEMGGASGTAEIEAWEPGRRLLLRHLPQPDAAPDDPTIREDWTIEPGAGGRSLLRLVHAGTPDGPKWQAYVEGTRRGWSIYLALLRHAAERHPGLDRTAITHMQFLPAPGSAVWGAALAALEPGDGAIRGPLGAPVAADVLERSEGEILVLTLPAHGHAALAVLLEPGADQAVFWAQVSFYGAAPDGEPWRRWLATLAPDEQV